MSTTPNPPDGEQIFTVTHPFHPLAGQSFSLLSKRFTWGEVRVQFLDPQTAQVRSLPVVWTDLAPPDPFLHLAAGRTILRLSDLQALASFLTELDHALPPDPAHNKDLVKRAMTNRSEK